ncbi:MAG: hypothetical protein ACM3SY_16160 [Candidatus Omnitrophota bacterium]
MERDFTLQTYRRLVEAIMAGGYTIQTFRDFLQTPESRSVIIRHDVDRRPYNSLRTAKIEDELGIRTSYYFRIKPCSYNEIMMKQIAAMGHEIGYHSEDLADAHGNAREAIRRFEINLNTFRKIVPIHTITMHGSPLSRWDNRDLWKIHDYRHYGIIGDPYYDLDFNTVLYLTETGRRWNSGDYNVRDWGKPAFSIDRSLTKKLLDISSTQALIRCFLNRGLPDRIMLTIHPERWDDNVVYWLRQLVFQRIKNQIKKIIVKKNGQIQNYPQP